MELFEKSRNAQLARHIETALPRELDLEEHIAIVREYCKQFTDAGMCVDFAIHDKGDGNPHAHILLTVRPMDERGQWLPKCKKVYDLDENGQRIRLPSGAWKSHKEDTCDWNDHGKANLWRKSWAETVNAHLLAAGLTDTIDHRNNAERGIEELPTIHMGVAACQMEKRGIVTERGTLNRNIQKTNRLMREVREQIEKLKAWLSALFGQRETLTQPPKSPSLHELLFKYLSVQREKSRKYSQGWQNQHTAAELKKVSQAIAILERRGLTTLEELDDVLSTVDAKTAALRKSVVARQKRMKELQKLIEQGKNYLGYLPIHDEAKRLQNGWKSKREKYEREHESELIVWNAANRYLHAHMPEGTKNLPVAAWETEYAQLDAAANAEYAEAQAAKAEVAELQNIRRCIDLALAENQPERERNHSAELE